MSSEKDDTILVAISGTDAGIQSIMILLVAIFFSIPVFSKNNAATIYSLYGMLYLGTYQLLSAVVRSFIERARKGRYWEPLFIYWMGVLLVLGLIFFNSTFHVKYRNIRYFPLILSGILAIYYCSICWKLTLQTNKNEH